MNRKNLQHINLNGHNKIAAGGRQFPENPGAGTTGFNSKYLFTPGIPKIWATSTLQPASLLI